MHCLPSIEYVLERFSPAPSGKQLLPPLSDPYARALNRLAAFRGNQTIVPLFYRFLQSQPDSDDEHKSKRAEYIGALNDFTKSMHAQGPFWGGKDMSLADVMVYPWIFRSTNVLKHFRSLKPEEWDAQEGGRMAKWLDAMMSVPAVASTCSTEDLYLDS